MSSASPSAIRARVSPVAGLGVSKVLPDAASHHCPDVLAAADLHFVQGDLVVDNGARGALHPDAHGPHVQAVVGPRERIGWAVGAATTASRQELNLLRRLELAELRQGAAEPDPVWAGLDQAERDEPAEPGPVLRLDHEMGDGTGHRVNDHAAHVAADPLGTADPGSDRELRWLRHRHPSSRGTPRP